MPSFRIAIANTHNHIDPPFVVVPMTLGRGDDALKHLAEGDYQLVRLEYEVKGEDAKLTEAVIETKPARVRQDNSGIKVTR